jgi:hypothetical protein
MTSKSRGALTTLTIIAVVLTGLPAAAEDLPPLSAPAGKYDDQPAPSRVGSAYQRPVSQGTVELGPRGFMFSAGLGISPTNKTGLDLPSLNARFGYLFGGRVSAHGGLEITHASMNWEEPNSPDDDNSIGLLSFHLGTKGMLFQPAQGKLVPFGTFTFFTAIPIFDSGLSQSVEGAYSVGFGAGVGVEYFIATQFSIGSEFGLNVLFYGADEANDPTPGSVSGHLLNTYLGFSLNYYLSQG